MNVKLLAGAGFAFAAIFNLSAAAHEMPAGTVQVSPVVPGMGEHWAEPADLPFGPIYGKFGDKLVFIEWMISQDDFEAGKSWTGLWSKNGEEMPPVDHIDIEFQPTGHEGFEVPHYDIHVYFVSHEEHMAYK